MVVRSKPESKMGGLGWGLLVVGLAVPSLIVFSWWSHQKGERDKSVSVKARGRASTGPLFQGGRGATKLVNPILAQPAAVSTSIAKPVPASPAPAPVDALDVPSLAKPQTSTS
ncbi:MAG: hypothetical protein AAB036_10260, partial [Elusimicrobiota bacterium]